MVKIFGVACIVLVNVLNMCSTHYFDSLELSEEAAIMIINPEMKVAEEIEPGCPQMHSLKNITLSEIFGHWRLPYMSTHWMEDFAFYDGGKSKKLTSTGKLCIKVNVKEIPQDVKTKGGVSDATIWIQSKCPHTGREWSADCLPTEELNSKWFCTERDKGTQPSQESFYKDSYVYIVDTDNYSWALVVRCYSNIEMNWAIFSKVKTLDTALVKSVLQKVESMGFKLLDVIEVPYEKCVLGPKTSERSSSLPWM